MPYELRSTQAPPARRPAVLDLPGQIEQQLELLHQTLAANALALSEARVAAARSTVGDLQLASEFAALERETIAHLRQARFELRTHTEAVARLVADLPRA